MDHGLDRVRARLRRFVIDRDWSQFHDPKNLAMAIASEAGELLAELRWVSNVQADDALRDPAKREQIEHEIADIAIALVLFCERAGIDLIRAIERKIELNEHNYPIEHSKGRSERPAASAHTNSDRPRVIAVDWSGEAGGGRKTIWIAEVAGGGITRLENGRSRTEVVTLLNEEAKRDSNLIVGIDFAFAFPRWFTEQHGLRDTRELWALAEREGESWLRECQPPFWGRPGQKKPQLPSDYRATELGVGRRNGGQAKSVFQIGGVGAVGTGSIRGMPYLAQLSAAGFSVWPFDPPRLPMLVEIYPRLLTGPVVKTSEESRSRYVGERYPNISSELAARAARSEDAFDAAISALVMWERVDELVRLPWPQGDNAHLEGQIWVPAGGAL
jgi:NTP pyrophosphatase (non-canonical NTP hydrolase)